MQEEQRTVDTRPRFATGRYSVHLDGVRLSLRDARVGREIGRIPCGTETAARALFDFMRARPAQEGEEFFAWVVRCAESYQAAVWVRLGRGRR